MKKYLGAFFLLILSRTGFAQQNITGIWEGKINAGTDFLLVFHIKEDNKILSATADFPDQGARGFAADSLVLRGDSILIAVSKLNGRYTGKIINDSTIRGYWISGRNISLNIRKVKQASLAKRPQTPQPPFPYHTEDILYSNRDSSIQYGATLTMPPGKGPFPALLLITGSGQQNRDEEMLQHKPFAVIADYLTRKGFIVLRVDDRDMGQTTGDLSKATSRDFANDAEVSLDYLKKRKEVDLRKIGLLGHSEGGMIAQIIAAERKDINFLIFLAAPGEPVMRLMSDQNAAVLRSVGFSPSYTDQYLQLYDSLLPAITGSSSSDEARQKAGKLVDEWKTRTSPEIVKATTGISDEETRQKFIRAFVSGVYSPWFRYFLQYDPGTVLPKINAKILALDGDKDIQVISKTNLPAMEASLKKSPSKDYELKELKGLNHLFQHCTFCNLQEYGRLEETIAPEVLQLIADWLQTHVAAIRS